MLLYNIFRILERTLIAFKNKKYKDYKLISVHEKLDDVN